VVISETPEAVIDNRQKNIRLVEKIKCKEDSKENTIFVYPNSDLA